MPQTEKIESLIQDLPDREGARRFFNQLTENHKIEANKLQKNAGLLSDVLAIAAFSPLLATTLLQNPNYISWLARQRAETKIRGKEELLESLARFSLTNSQIEPQILLARFRRRELLRIYLRDLRRLGTIAELTEEISHLADAILEYALRLARQELDNRYGIPLEIDKKQRAKPARFCIVSLGKLGSNELNYASDIDLLFLYSADGATSGQGSRGAVTNREYFIKLAEFVTKITGGQAGEGAAYRVDLRLRPHGRVGTLAVSVAEAVGYYQNSAQAWERQTLIRSRSSAGDAKIFKEFFAAIENHVFSKDETVHNALQNVRRSKEKINLEHAADNGFNVKLGTGGIREIEFIAQALQLAYGGRDAWVRAPHTLISLARLADRRLLSESELTELFGAYNFLRRLEHRLQMENGLQTHIVPKTAEKRLLTAKKMNFADAENFENRLSFHTANVHRIFRRVFGESDSQPPADTIITRNGKASSSFDVSQTEDLRLLKSLEKSDFEINLPAEKLASLKKFCRLSPHFAETLATNPQLIADFPRESDSFQNKNYAEIFRAALSKQSNYRAELAVLRLEWTKNLLEIAAFDVYEKIDFAQSKLLQTELAEASLQAALAITKRELTRRFNFNENLDLTVLGLGKLGGRGMDYGSDLDLVLVYDEIRNPQITNGEDQKSETADRNENPQLLYSRAVEIFVAALSSFTREGHLYRVDLRLRPDGKNGATALGKNAFLGYLKNRSAMWEWLAYVKLRGVTAGAENPALEIEKEARKIVHENALKIEAGELKNETRRVRARLEQEKTRGAKDINIKFGAGGLLDVYFAMRFLQLRDNVPDDAENRSTQFMLKKLRENNSLNREDFSALSAGHEFLSLLDHNLRLIVGRSNRLPLANQTALQTLCDRMKLGSIEALFENLNLHRLEIRHAFENILR